MIKLNKNNLKMSESESYNYEKIRIFDEKVREFLNRCIKPSKREINFN
jgi:hypothetical protein